MTRARGLLIGGLLALATPVLAVAQWRGVAVTPYLGLYVPTKDFLTPPAATIPEPSTQKVDVSIGYGARISAGVAPHWGVEGDLGVASGHLVVSSVGAVAGNDVKTVVGSGRVYYRTRPASEPFSATALAGLAVVSHRFSRTSEAGSPVVGDKTSLGGVVGGTIAFRLEERTALTLGLDGFVYSAQVDYNGQPTTARMQVDARLIVGLRIAIAGY
jgi:hypothetical protein